MPDTKNRQMELMLAPAQEKLIGRNIAKLCENAAVTIDSETNALLLPSMGEVIHIRLPDFVFTQELDMWRHLTLLQYLDTADGTPLAGREIALSEMRGGLSRGLGFDKDISLMFSVTYVILMQTLLLVPAKGWVDVSSPERRTSAP